MSKIKVIPHEHGTHYMFMCPGCNCAHSVNQTWGFNNDVDKPTFTPSVLVTGRGDPNYRCHSFVTDGKIQFLEDCSHQHKGQTLDLLEWGDDNGTDAG